MLKERNILENEENSALETQATDQAILQDYADKLKLALHSDRAVFLAWEQVEPILDEMSDKQCQAWILENIAKPIAEFYGDCETRISKYSKNIQFYHKGGIKNDKRHDAARKKFHYFQLTSDERTQKYEDECKARLENAKKEVKDEVVAEVLAEVEQEKKFVGPVNCLEGRKIKHEGGDDEEFDDSDSGYVDPKGVIPPGYPGYVEPDSDSDSDSSDSLPKATLATGKSRANLASRDSAIKSISYITDIELLEELIDEINNRITELEEKQDEENDE